jgi:hypothetical protein
MIGNKLARNPRNDPQVIRLAGVAALTWIDFFSAVGLRLDSNLAFGNPGSAEGVGTPSTPSTGTNDTLMPQFSCGQCQQRGHMNKETESLESLRMTTPEQTRKVPPKGTPERREYNRLKKVASRSKAKQGRLATEIPTASEWMEQFPVQHHALHTELNQYVNEFAESVLSELQINSSHSIAACLDQVARPLLGLQRGWLREVQAPAGELVSGMYFPEALGESIVHDTHRYHLEQSPTYSATYRELLRILDTKFGHENTEHARSIRQELSGEYVLAIPVDPQPAPEPTPAVAEPRLLSDAEILERGRMQLLDQIQNPLLSPEARNFLYGH